MKLKPGINDILWMAAGAAALAVCILVVLHFHNDATPDIRVDPETYSVTADGELLVCEPADSLPMAQRYFMF